MCTRGAFTPNYKMSLDHLLKPFAHWWSNMAKRTFLDRTTAGRMESYQPRTLTIELQIKGIDRPAGTA